MMDRITIPSTQISWEVPNMTFVTMKVEYNIIGINEWYAVLTARENPLNHRLAALRLGQGKHFRLGLIFDV